MACFRAPEIQEEFRRTPEILHCSNSAQLRFSVETGRNLSDIWAALPDTSPQVRWNQCRLRPAHRVTPRPFRQKVAGIRPSMVAPGHNFAEPSHNSPRIPGMGTPTVGRSVRRTVSRPKSRRRRTNLARHHPKFARYGVGRIWLGIFVGLVPRWTRSRPSLERFRPSVRRARRSLGPTRGRSFRDPVAQRSERVAKRWASRVDCTRIGSRLDRLLALR